MTDIEINIADEILERPYAFEYRGRYFYLYRPTLGKIMLLGRLFGELGISQELLQTSVQVEMMRLVEQKRDYVVRIIAYSTMREKKDIFSAKAMKSRCDMFAEMDDADLAALLQYVLTMDRTNEYEAHYNLAEEYKKLMKLQEAKDNGNNIVLCGKSIWGTLVDPVCERYGWTMDYVVWGISYVNLQMLLKDQMQNIYFSDEEAKKAGIFKRKGAIKADDPNNKEIILNNWKN